MNSQFYAAQLASYRRNRHGKAQTCASAHLTAQCSHFRAPVVTSLQTNRYRRHRQTRRRTHSLISKKPDATTNAATSPFTSWQGAPNRTDPSVSLSSHFGLSSGDTPPTLYAQTPSSDESSTDITAQLPSQSLSSEPYGPASTSNWYGIIDADWSELGLRTVLETLAQPVGSDISSVPNPTAPDQRAGTVSCAFSELGSESAPQLQPQSSTALPSTDAYDPSGAEISWNEQYLASSVPSHGVNSSSDLESGLHVDQNAVRSTIVNDSVFGVGGESMPSLELGPNRSLLEAWRAINEFPDFADTGMDWTMDSLFTSTSQ